MASGGASRESHATTVRIPLSVYRQAKDLVDSKKNSAATYLSLNDFFVTAIKSYVKMQKRREIDAAFAMMAEDYDYQNESSLLAEAFALSDREISG